jgi:ribosomal protein L19E
VLARDELGRVDRLVVLVGDLRVVAADLIAKPDRPRQRQAGGERDPRREVQLHREHRHRGAVRVLHVVVDEGAAQVAAEREPRRQLHEAVQEVAVAAEGRELLADGVVAVAREQTAARGRVVALVAAHRARRQLPLGIGQRRGFADEHEPERSGEDRQQAARQARHDSFRRVVYPGNSSGRRDRIATSPAPRRFPRRPRIPSPSVT